MIRLLRGAPGAASPAPQPATCTPERAEAWYSSVRCCMPSILLSTALLAAPAPAASAVEPYIQACQPRTSCVSTSSYLSPSQYLPPWSFAPDTREHAIKQLQEELLAAGASITAADSGAGQLAAVLPPPSRSQPAALLGRVLAAADAGSDVVQGDDLRFLLREDGTVLFSSRSQSRGPDPPFCLTPGCISGPGNRGRMQELLDSLGWQVLETDEDKEWVQILLH